MNKSIFYLAALAGISFTIICCKKNNLVTDKDPLSVAYVKFDRNSVSDSLKTYTITPANDPYKVAISVTNTSNVDRTIQLSYSSPTAVNGTHYTAPASIVIPAGELVDTFYITGNSAAFASCESDTLRIEILTGDAVGIGATYPTQYVILKKSSAINVNDFLGIYSKTNESLGTSTYGPYVTTIDSVSQTSATTGIIRVTNIYDNSWNPIIFMLDWTNPANKKITLVQQIGIATGDLLDSSIPSTYDVAVRPFTGQIGSFSECTQTFTLKLQIGYGTAGTYSWLSNLYTVTLQR